MTIIYLKFIVIGMRMQSFNEIDVITANNGCAFYIYRELIYPLHLKTAEVPVVVLVNINKSASLWA